MQTIKIDFVSDIACPWCAVGLASLREAIANVKDDIQVELHFQPFELNPTMPLEGEDVVEHLSKKYRMSAEQVAQNQAHIRQRGAEVGFTFSMQGRSRIYNTFDAHRLLHWAEVELGAEAQHKLKWALLETYFTLGQNPSNHTDLLSAVTRAGFDAERAAVILGENTYEAEVRVQEKFYTQQGISSVPSVIFNDQHLLQGGQPAAMFEQAIREIAASSA
jgi:predicted DsbA family dithiol-disulfide isomerase